MIKYLKSFRGQLVFSLLFTGAAVLGFGFYIFLKSGLINALALNPSPTPTDIAYIQSEITAVRQASFFLIAVIFTLSVGLLVNLIITLSYSLKSILDGIKAIDNGNLAYTIKIQSENEFGEIATFLNKAAEHLNTTQKQLIEAKTNVEKQIVERTDELRTEKNKLSLTLANTTDGVIAVDLEGKISLFNASAQQITGYSEQEVLGRPIQDIITITSDERVIPFAEYCRRPEGSEHTTFQKNEVKLHGKQEHETFVNVTSGYITEGSNANLGWILTIHDVSEKYHLEQMKLDFVSMAAHELRTPLTSIRGYLSIFLHENENKFDGTQQMFLNRIQFSTTQLLALIENLLSVSKIERGIFNIQTQPTDWTNIIRETVNDFQERAKDRKISLKLEEPANKLSPVLVDTLRITEVVTNLLTNSLTYTKENGTVTVRLEENDSEVITHISDTGEGIPKDALPHLFKKFFRVSGVLEQGSKGTGLGLYIAKSIVEMHKGRIWTDSQLGKGSTFSFSIPKA